MAPLKIGFNAQELKQHGVLERMKAGKLNQLEAAGKLSLRRHQLMAAWDEARMKRLGIRAVLRTASADWEYRMRE